MSRNGKLEPMEVETMMNEARMLNNIIEVGERMIVSDKMEEARSKQVVNESIVDTKTNRYIYNTGNGNIERLPLEKLNTTYALIDWEVVGNVKDL